MVNGLKKRNESNVKKIEIAARLLVALLHYCENESRNHRVNDIKNCYNTINHTQEGKKFN